MSKTALVVDDSPSMRQMISYVLAQDGYAVLEGENGQEGLVRLQQSDVQLVLTDMNMPVMDGISFIRELRKLSKHRFTPVLMVTTESDGDKRAQGKAAGATGWVVKPFDPNKLLQVVRRVSP